MKFVDMMLMLDVLILIFMLFCEVLYFVMRLVMNGIVLCLLNVKWMVFVFLFVV